MGSTGGDRSPDIVSGAIPIVDFSRWQTNTSKADQLSVARDLTDACRTVGFVYITNHGLPQPLLDQAFNTAKRLFSLTHEEKMQAPHPDGPEIHRGYSFPGLEKVSQYAGGDDEVGEQLRQVSDCKESYEIGSEENSQQPNVWLPEATLPGCRAFTTEFYWECNKAAREILRALAMGIGLEDPEYLLRYHSGHNNQLRLLHYPPIPAAELESRSVARMPAHSDWSTMTMLFQDDCGGLEVADPRTAGKFIPATPVKGACVVNVGDLLMRWSNDYLISTLHRVTLPPLSDRFEGEHRMTRARYSIPYFVTADADSLVECLPACTDAQHPIKYDPVTQEAYARTRAKLQYRTSKAVAAAA